MDRLMRQAVAAPGPEREKLLSFITHEVRNPLASGLWAVEMLARPGLDPARGERLGRLATRSLRRLRTLVEDHFALERVPAKLAPGQVDVREAVERALGPRDLDPDGIEAPLAGPTGLISPLPDGPVDRLLNACARRMARAGEGGPLEVDLFEIDHSVVVRLFRSGLSADEIDPPELRSGGSEGAGTTFALLVARAYALRLGVGFRVEDAPGGTVLLLRFPLNR